MTVIRMSLMLGNGLLFAILLLRLVRLKRAIDAYRPPSPLPPRASQIYSLTITRVS